MTGWQRLFIWSAAGTVILVHVLLFRLYGAIDTDIPDPTPTQDLLWGLSFAFRFHGALLLAPLATGAHPLIRVALAAAMVPGAWQLTSGLVSALPTLTPNALIPLYWIGAYVLGFYILARGTRSAATRRAA